MNRFDRDVAQFLALKEEAERIKDNDPVTAYRLMVKSNALYDRWSTIHYEARIHEAKRGQESAFKDRVNEIMKYLSNVHTYCRMIWKGKERIGSQRE